MNARRGFLRLWIVFSVLVLIGVTALNYSNIHSEFRRASVRSALLANLHAGMVPVGCVDPVPRGTAGADYAISHGLCWYKMADLRRLYPEYKSLSDSTLSDKLRMKIGWESLDAHPWRTILGLAEDTVVVLAAVFILGYALIWAFAGFRSRASG